MKPPSQRVFCNFIHGLFILSLYHNAFSILFPFPSHPVHGVLADHEIAHRPLFYAHRFGSPTPLLSVLGLCTGVTCLENRGAVLPAQRGIDSLPWKRVDSLHSTRRKTRDSSNVQRVPLRPLHFTLSCSSCSFFTSPFCNCCPSPSRSTGLHARAGVVDHLIVVPSFSSRGRYTGVSLLPATLDPPTRSSSIICVFIIFHPRPQRTHCLLAYLFGELPSSTALYSRVSLHLAARPYFNPGLDIVCPPYLMVELTNILPMHWTLSVSFAGWDLCSESIPRDQRYSRSEGLVIFTCWRVQCFAIIHFPLSSKVRRRSFPLLWDASADSPLYDSVPSLARRSLGIG